MNIFTLDVYLHLCEFKLRNETWKVDFELLLKKVLQKTGMFEMKLLRSWTNGCGEHVFNFCLRSDPTRDCNIVLISLKNI